MGIVFKNNAKTTLASSLSNSATSATVTDGSVFPSLSAGEFFLITFDDGTNNEICKCTARSGNTLTIVRAQESTTARAFSSGDSAEGRVTAGVLEQIQENIAAKSANQTVFNTTTSGGATTYDIGTNPGVEANAMVFLNGVLQHHDTLSFSGSNLTFDAAPPNGMALEVIIDNLINLQSSNLTVDSFTAADVSGSPQTDFTLSDAPAAETNLIVFVDGVFQDQDAYTISSQTLSITDGVIAGRGVTVYVINPVNIGTPSDSTVTSAKLSGNITMPGTLTVGSNDVAFDSPTFVVDHTNSRVGLGIAAPTVPVDIVGDVKMSAGLTVDTTTLVVDSSNNRVGIGDAAPADKLEINGGSSYPHIRITSSSNTSRYMRIGMESATNHVIEANGSSTVLSFKTAGSEQMQLQSDGKLAVKEIKHLTDGNLEIGNGDEKQIFDATNQAVQIQTADTERVYIDSKSTYATVTGIPRDGLVCHFEVLHPVSNPGTTVWYNLAGSENISLSNIGGPTYAFQGYGSNYFEINNNSSWTMTSPTAARVSSATVGFWIHSNNPQFLYLQGSSTNNYLGANKSSNGLYFGGTSGSPTTYYNYSTTTNLFERNYNSSGQWAWVEFNGVNLTDANWDEFKFASYTGYEPQDHHTALGGFFVWDKAISSAERAQVIQYLHGKYGSSPTWQTHTALVSAGGAHGSNLNSPFSAYGSGFTVPGYYRDANMRVHLQGLLGISGTANASSTIFTLPKGFRPKERVLLTTQTNPNVDVRLDILDDGSVITVESMTVWCSLDNLSFLANGE